MSSSSDDIPIEQIAARATTAEIPARSVSPVPDWISQYHSPAAARSSPAALSSDDSDVVVVTEAQPADRSNAEAEQGQPRQGSAKHVEAAPKNSQKGKASSGNRSPTKAGTNAKKQVAPVIPTVAATLQKVGIQPEALVGEAGADEEVVAGELLALS